MKLLLPFFLIVSFAVTSCPAVKKTPLPGVLRYDEYAGLLAGRSVAVTANQTSMAGEVHIVDFLLQRGVAIKAIFAPEHGFREMADAGEAIIDGRDAKTGLPVISLYGNHRKPAPDDLSGIDVVIFDIQDVGVRFYTYLGTLHYLMEACAENGVKCLVLDRPDPNGFYVDGNVLDTAYSSFVGMHPVPVVHGMTVGEYAGMINGEGWLKGGVKCDLTVISCLDYDHGILYELPVRPSPNLPNQNAVYLYPSICFFEGTTLSLGRGTPFPFQVYGSPHLPDRGFSFIPVSMPGAKNPPLMGVKCFGTDLRNALGEGLVPDKKINLDWIINAYKDYPEKEKFFTSYFDVLSGGPVLREQIIEGMTQEEIRETWQEGLNKFRELRKRYLLYKE
ncbi:MAG TPA: DUF1343 domain-containing protein [Bacteroidales bacterium]|nr:DUF1343 domain-containing protein [Bacteroidales bacterium]HPF02814.1 DUF1343 domain-containing protein [Bacteroidales bacterium]HPJ58103.1 DUF1343 domain-containing protein [Bacteroidales bacterium]HPR12448.1 DUF1343 domain-containing protein [Bacteroidales bacterium]HRW84513.1 DUF1343 domain-containing protein [Bacteroidales bacterium]